MIHHVNTRKFCACGIAVVIVYSISSLQASAEVVIATAGPLTGDQTWYGEQMQRGAELAVSEINKNGGLLGHTVRLIVGDDSCDADKAVALAKKLVSDDVKFVAGHVCSGAAIPASDIYEESDVVMIAPTASNPKLTEQGKPNVFRLVGRDDMQGPFAAEYVAERWGNKNVAILHDGEAYGEGLAYEMKSRLRQLDIHELIFEAIMPGLSDYEDVINRLISSEIDILYYGGYSPEAGLILRQARDMGSNLQLVSGDALFTEVFWKISGEEGEGTIFTSFPDPRNNREADDVVKKFKDDGYEPEGVTLFHYAAVQVWALAVEKANSLVSSDIIKTLRENEFDTILGRIGFDDKGDVTGYEKFVWYEWNDGKYVPLD